MDCSFCGKEIPKGTGILFAKKTGQTFNFCGKKCEKNMIKLKRQPRKTKWTKDYAKLKAVNIAAKEHAQKEKKEKTTQSAKAIQPVETSKTKEIKESKKTEK